MLQDPHFVYDNNTLTLVRNMLKAEDREIIIAVAFWGNSAIEKLGVNEWKAKRVKLVCNATSGSCNPNIIDDLRKRFHRRVKTNPSLHAKVYWTPRKVVVTSANASSSGLWGEESGGNIEAGLASDFEPLVCSIKRWLDKIYQSEKTIIVDEDVIKVAWDRWVHRVKLTSNVSDKGQKKVLNAMDLDVAIKYPKSGIYTGVWTAPDTNCETIRIFAGDSEHSSLGGPIVDEEPAGNHRRRIYFRDDPDEHAKPRPREGFKQNGCRATPL